jgi:hypothetical protein
MSLHPIEALESHLPPQRKLRIVALIDVVKAAIVLAAGFGLLELDPSNGIARGFLALMQGADRNHGVLATVAGAYAALRLVEAYGLWFARNWARWLGLFSAGIYVPFEIAYLVRQPNAIGVGVLAVNLAVLWLLWPRRAFA